MTASARHQVREEHSRTSPFAAPSCADIASNQQPSPPCAGSHLAPWRHHISEIVQRPAAQIDNPLALICIGMRTIGMRTKFRSLGLCQITHRCGDPLCRSTRLKRNFDPHNCLVFLPVVDVTYSRLSCRPRARLEGQTSICERQHVNAYIILSKYKKISIS